MKTTIVMITLIIASQMVRADVASQIVKLPPNQGPRLRLGPKPPVERFPSTPYVAPPTPEERVAAKLHAEELIAARKAHRAAVTNLLASVGVDASPTADPATIKERARVISNVADVLRRNPSMMKDVSEAAPEGGDLSRGK